MLILGDRDPSVTPCHNTRYMTKIDTTCIEIPSSQWIQFKIKFKTLFTNSVLSGLRIFVQAPEVPFCTRMWTLLTLI